MRNGESIYGAGRSNFIPPPDAHYTQKGDILYLHLFNYVSGWRRGVVLPGMGGKVEYATLVRDGSDIEITELGEDLGLLMPAQMPDPIDTVVALKLKSS